MSSRGDNLDVLRGWAVLEDAPRPEVGSPPLPSTGKAKGGTLPFPKLGRGAELDDAPEPLPAAGRVGRQSRARTSIPVLLSA